MKKWNCDRVQLTELGKFNNLAIKSILADLIRKH